MLSVSTMLRTRSHALSALRSWRVSSSPRPLRRGLRPLHGCMFRYYSGSSNYRDKIQRRVADERLPSQSWKDYIIFPTAILAIAGVGIFIHYNDERRAVLKGSTQDTVSRQTNNGPVIGGPFKLIDTENRFVTESDLRGNWILMYFGYTSSPDVGPEEVQKMAKVIDILESGHNLKIMPVFITLDPQRDSPSQLKAYLKEFDTRIVGLTGPVAAIRQMAHEYRIYFKKVGEEGQDYIIESSNNMYLLDPNMKVVKCFGVEYDPLELSDAILEEVKKVSK